MMSLPLDQNTIIGVDFGPGKTGKAVGLTVLDADNQELVARTTENIYEILGSKGAFGLKRSFSSAKFTADAAGYWFVWDTGEADDTKAVFVEKVIFYDPAAGKGAASGGGSSGTSGSSGSRKSVITYDSESSSGGGS